MTKRGTDLFDWNVRELANALEVASKWLRWELEILEDFHACSHMIGGSPGSNVFENVLREALKAHGMTLEQFRAERKKKS